MFARFRLNCEHNSHESLRWGEWMCERKWFMSNGEISTSEERLLLEIFLPFLLRLLSQCFRVNFGDHHTRWRFFFQPIDLCPLPKPDQAKSWVLFVYRRNRNSARLGCLLLNRRRCPPIYYTRRVRDDKIVSSITQIQKWFHGKIMNSYQINEISRKHLPNSIQSDINWQNFS